MENEISHVIIGAAIEVHTVLGGPGLLESVYESCLFHELILRGHNARKQVHIPIHYKGIFVRDPLCMDLLVDEKVIVEVKAVDKLHSIHEAQLLTYLRLTGKRLGLIINFGQKYLKDGISRVVNEL